MSEITTKLLNHDYLLTCPDGQEDTLRQAVQYVDTTVTAWRESGKLRLREQASVIVAVNLAFERISLQEQITALQQQVQALRQELTDRPTTASAPPPPQTQQRMEHLMARMDALLHAPLPAGVSLGANADTPISPAPQPCAPDTAPHDATPASAAP